MGGIQAFNPLYSSLVVLSTFHVPTEKMLHTHPISFIRLGYFMYLTPRTDHFNMPLLCKTKLFSGRLQKSGIAIFLTCSLVLLQYLGRWHTSLIHTRAGSLFAGRILPRVSALKGTGGLLTLIPFLKEPSC